MPIVNFRSTTARNEVRPTPRPESIPSGTYDVTIEQIAVRDTNGIEKAIVRYRVKGERVARTEWLNLQWATIDNPMGCQHEIFARFAELCIVTRAAGNAKSRESVGVYGRTEDEQDINIAVGDYDLENTSCRFEIVQREATNQFELDKLADDRHMLNVIDTALPPLPKKASKTKTASKAAKAQKVATA